MVVLVELFPPRLCVLFIQNSFSTKMIQVSKMQLTIAFVLSEKWYQNRDICFSVGIDPSRSKLLIAVKNNKESIKSVLAVSWES